MFLEKGLTFKQVMPDDELSIAVNILRKSFGTVAAEFGLTEENCRSNPAFINEDLLKEQLKSEKTFFLLFHGDTPVGSVAIEKSPDQPGVYYIERVAVIPEIRHKGFGKELMNYATSRIISMGGKKISIAIIDENRVLKSWYAGQGFIDTGIRKFGHLPFTVCFMHKLLG
jgi:ribosomal protein S18 acetylase RimI-like enzyme